MQFDRMMIRFAAVAVLSASVLWAQMPEVMAADAAQPAIGGIAPKTTLARAGKRPKKKVRKAKRTRKSGRKPAPKKPRKRAVSA